jgi:hypothetical protein
LPAELLRGKFIDCAGRALSMEGAERLFGLLDGLEAVDRIGAVTEATVPDVGLAAD